MTQRQTVFFLYFLFLSGLSALSAQSYLWPTNASHYMTSSFCEYRPGHYHSAIDIKTWNREGYSVYAVDDGFLYKVRVSPFGYGKALYIKLKDGRLAVYGHLQKFNPKIERAIRKLQIRQKRYSVTFVPEHWPLKRGQLVAYSGQTGIGVPHLHFEIRADEMHPLNPLHFYKEVKDHLRPRLQSLLVIPQDNQTRVNSSFLPQRIPLINRGRGQYELARPLYASGRIGLALRGFDQADGVYNKFSFYRVELYVNGQRRFRIQYDTLSFKVTRQVDVEIYYPFKANFGQVFHKLYIEPYNRLPFYDRRLGNGLLQVTNDSLQFKIRASDFFGNTSTVRGVIIPLWEPRLSASFVKRLPGSILLQLLLPARLQKLSFALNEGRASSWRRADYFEILQRRFSDKRQEMLVRLPSNDAADSLVKVVVGRRGVSAYQAVFPITDSVGSQKSLRFRLLPKTIFFSVRPLNIRPAIRLEIRQGAKVVRPALSRSASEWQTVLAGSEVAVGDTMYVALKSADTTLTDTMLTVYRFVAGQPQEFSFFNDTLHLGVSEKTVYDTLLFTVNKTILDSSVKAAYAAFGPLYRIQSAAVAFRKSAYLRLRLPSVPVYWRQVGLARRRAEGRLSFIGGRVDSLRQSVSARLKGFGDFCVVADTVPPQMTLIHPLPGANLSVLHSIRFSTEDTLSGIGSERNLKIEVDGKFVIPEWDPERNIVTGRPHWTLSRGAHEILIEIRDGVGNKRQKRFNIYIEPGRKD